MLTRGDVEILDPVEEEQSWDAIDDPGLPDDVAFTIGDWLALLKPTSSVSIRSWRTLKRLSGMVAVISGIVLVVVTFSWGRPTTNATVNLETAAVPSILSENADSGVDAAPSTLPLALAPGVSPNLLSSPEAEFLGLVAAPVETTTSTTTSTTTPTTTKAAWSEPVIPPESEWVDAGNGVMVPDVLLRIRFCESTNNYRAAHTVSSARGAYQFLTRSWDWYGHAARYGVASADLATPAQQDEAALMTLRRDGTRPWLASWGCWGSDTLPANYATIRPAARPTTTSTPTSDTTSSDDTSSSTVTSTAPTTASTETAVTTTSTPTSDTTSSTAASSSSSASTTSTTGTGDG